MPAADGNDATVIELAEAGQRLSFVPARAGQDAGITAVTTAVLPCERPREIGGVSFVPGDG